jgi:hypothetical protein
MKKLHIDLNYDINNGLKEGQRDSMCSNNESYRCPSLSIKNSNLLNEDEALDYLASIIVQAYLDQKENERDKPNKI